MNTLARIVLTVLVIVVAFAGAFDLWGFVCWLQSMGIDLDRNNDGINDLPGCPGPAYCYPDSCGYRR